MLHAAIPALRRASSKLDRRSRCFPTPLVRKIFFATNAMSCTELRCLHRIESKNRAQRKLTSTRSDVNGIQRRGEILMLQKHRGGGPIVTAR